MAVYDLAGIVQTLLSGLVLASTYSLLAMGLTLIYSTLRIVNFAHGSLYMIGGFIVWTLTAPFVPASTLPQQGLTGLALPFYVGLAAAVGVLFVMGMGIQRVMLGPLIRRPSSVLTTLVATLAFATILEGIAYLLFSAAPRLTPPLATGFLRAGDLIIEYSKIIQLGVALSVLMVVQLILKRTQYGLAMRAVAQDREAASLCRVNIAPVYVYTFALGSALAAVAAGLLSSVLYLDVTTGRLALISAFVIVLFGGIGSVSGTLLAAFVISFTQQYATYFVNGYIGWLAALGLVVFVLAVRPQGLFGYTQ